MILLFLPFEEILCPRVFFSFAAGRRGGIPPYRRRIFKSSKILISKTTVFSIEFCVSAVSFFYIWKIFAKIKKKDSLTAYAFAAPSAFLKRYPDSYVFVRFSMFFYAFLRQKFVYPDFYGYNPLSARQYVMHKIKTKSYGG